MKKVRKFSVVTVTLNCADTIALTLQSVREQTFPGVEHVVIDGGSSDGTAEIVRGYDVGYFVSEPDGGIYQAMEKGVAAATGDVVIFLNSGDVFHDPRVCEDVAAYFQRTGSAVVFGDFMPYLIRPEDPYDHHAFTPNQACKLETVTNRNCLYNQNIHHQAAFYRREIFAHCSFFSPENPLGSDYELNVSALVGRGYSASYLPRVVSKFALGGVTTSDYDSQIQEFTQLREMLRNKYFVHMPRVPDDEYRHVESPRRDPWLKRLFKKFPLYAWARSAWRRRARRKARGLIEEIAREGMGAETVREFMRRSDALYGGVLLNRKELETLREDQQAMSAALLAKLGMQQEAFDRQQVIVSQVGENLRQSQQELAECVAGKLQRQQEAFDRQHVIVSQVGENLRQSQQELAECVAGKLQRQQEAVASDLQRQQEAVASDLQRQQEAVVGNLQRQQEAVVGNLQRQQEALDRQQAVVGQLGENLQQHQAQLSAALAGSLEQQQEALNQQQAAVHQLGESLQQHQTHVSEVLAGKMDKLQEALDRQQTAVRQSGQKQDASSTALLGILKRQQRALLQQQEGLALQRTLLSQVGHQVHHRGEIVDQALSKVLESVYRSTDENDLRRRGYRLTSQFDEDGLIQYLLDHVAIENKVFVEFGVESYAEANTRFLLHHSNWSGLVMDSSEPYMRDLRQRELYWRHNLQAVCAFITTENINELIDNAGISGDIGLLSIDIDGVDYWVWEAITAVQPRIVICEYNSMFGHAAKVVVPYEPQFDRTKKHYSYLYGGASLGALAHLAEQKGYCLVASNRAGNNAFFVRNDVLSDLQPLSVKEAYVKAQFRESRGPDGQLTFLPIEEGIDLIGHLPVVDLETGQTVKIETIDARYDECRSPSRQEPPARAA